MIIKNMYESRSVCTCRLSFNHYRNVSSSLAVADHQVLQVTGDRALVYTDTIVITLDYTVFIHVQHVCLNKISYR